MTCQAVDADAWQLTGNAGTAPGTHYVGTSDNQALVLKENGAGALRLEPHATSPNLLGGHSGNWITPGVYGATIGGGGNIDSANRVTDAYGTVGGGRNNQAGDDAGTVDDQTYATVGGGWLNTASGTFAGFFAGQIYATGCVGCLLVHLGQNAGDGALRPGDLVAVSGLGEPLAGAAQPMLRIHRAGAGEAVVGVVLARGARTEAVKDGRSLESIDRAEGDVQPGGYLFLAVHGPAQVRADATAGAIAAGTRLVAGQGGAARALQTRTVDGLAVAEAAPGVGIALEALDSGAGLIWAMVTLR